MGLTTCDDYADVFRVSRHKAAKEYRCGECGGFIRPGEQYRREFLVIFGDAYDGQVCNTCDELIVRFFAALRKIDMEDLTYEFGELYDAIVDLRNEYGATVEGFKYPSAEIIQLRPHVERSDAQDRSRQ
ncbi:MAG: hypothetical protein AAF468_12510 [Pseudomonadota bacterium]